VPYTYPFLPPTGHSSLYVVIILMVKGLIVLLLHLKFISSSDVVTMN